MEVVAGDAHGGCVRETAADAVDDGECAVHCVDTRREGRDDEGEGTDDAARHDDGSTAAAVDEHARQRTEHHRDAVTPGADPCCRHT